MYYHVCVQVLSEGTVHEHVQFALQAAEGAPVIKSAACMAAIVKRMAATITNSGGNALLDFSKPLVSFFTRHKGTDSRVKNAETFLIVSIESEGKCLSFLQNKSVLGLLGMEQHLIAVTSTARMSYPLFTVNSAHPLYKLYAFFADNMKSGNKNGFISSLSKRIEDEKVDKPRLKRKQTYKLKKLFDLI